MEMIGNQEQCAPRVQDLNLNSKKDKCDRKKLAEN